MGGSWRENFFSRIKPAHADENKRLMHASQTPNPAELTTRTTELEVLFTHLQKTMQELNQVILQQGRQLDRLQAQMTQLTADYRAVSAGPPLERNPLEERPPHY